MSTSAEPTSLRSFVRAIPKAELHVHLEGSVPPATALRLARRHGVRLPAEDEEGLRSAYEFSDFRDFIRLYVAISRCFADADSFAEAVDDVAVGLAEQNVVYAEMTVTPMTHVERGVPARSVLAGLREGRRRAYERGVELRWVFDIVRSIPEQAEGTLALALEARDQDQGVVALGLGGPERAGTPESLDEVFARARAAGLGSVPHAGEIMGAASVRAAVERLGAQRLGHGVRVLEDPEVVQLVRSRGVKLEVCPSSNVALGVVSSLAAHPLPALLEAGLLVSLGSDDPPLFGTSLTEEYVRVGQAFAWGEHRLFELMRNAVEHALCDASTRTALRTAQDQALARWSARDA